MMRKSLVLTLVLAAGCGNGGNNGDDGEPAIDAPGTNPDAPPIPDGYTRLIGRTWNLDGGQSDTYRCVRFTVPEAMYITNILAQAPTGTHHTVLSIAGANGTSGPDGDQDTCGVGFLGTVMLYASGVGTSPLDFPTGVGLKINPGTQLHLNLHLFNASDKPINGDTAILVKAQSTPPPMLAEMVFAGNMFPQIPKDDPPYEPYTLQGGCTVSKPYTLFALWPHMHKIATHQRVELIRGGTTTVLHDLPFTFMEQNYYLKTPEISVQVGDRLNVQCTYVNTTGRKVTFGESSNDEMCFNGLYRYPAQNSGLFDCTSL